MPSTKSRTASRTKATPKSGGTKKPAARGKGAAKKPKPRDEEAEIEKNAEELDGLGETGETELADDEEELDDEEEVDDKASDGKKEIEVIDDDFGFGDGDELGKVEDEIDEVDDLDEDDDEEKDEPEGDDEAVDDDRDPGRGDNKDDDP